MTSENNSNSSSIPNPGMRILREDIEWSSLWLPDSNKHDLPRCLLIGDSITGGYRPEVEKLMAGKAYIGIFGTSKSIGDSYLIPELKLAIGQAEFDVIHFNNGMHGWDYSETGYERDFPDVLEAIRQSAPNAELIWASITPVRQPEDLEQFAERTERVKVRNLIAAKYANAARIPINDLFAVGAASSSHYFEDGIHFSESGSAALALQVVEQLSLALND